MNKIISIIFLIVFIIGLSLMAYSERKDQLAFESRMNSLNESNERLHIEIIKTLDQIEKDLKAIERNVK